ncbi:MAG: 50S ribosomal protein L1 [Actinobacteria bacterium]|nr:50S ribosomal protein L1 [Actinomycetota bacterium]
MKRGKRYLDTVKSLNKNELFSPYHALKWIKENNFTKFDESVDISINLGVDPRKADQIVRGTLVLPHGTGKIPRVLVFAQGDKAAEAKNAGADYIGGEELVEKVGSGWVDFDVCITTPDMMKHVGKLGKILGPRKLMPNPKSGTVTMEVEKAVKDSKRGRLEYRTDKSGVIHSPIGRVSFDLEKLLNNYQAFTEAIIKAKPASAKGKYIKSIYLSSTMGPGIKIDQGKPAEIEAVA